LSTTVASRVLLVSFQFAVCLGLSASINAFGIFQILFYIHLHEQSESHGGKCSRISTWILATSSILSSGYWPAVLSTTKSAVRPNVLRTSDEHNRCVILKILILYYC
ncbi:hypothetical protein T01_865, partial [Trichinella spiralis]